MPAILSGNYVAGIGPRSWVGCFRNRLPCPKPVLLPRPGLGRPCSQEQISQGMAQLASRLTAKGSLQQGNLFRRQGKQLIDDLVDILLGNGDLRG